MKAVIQYDDEQDPRDGRDITITYVGNDRSFASSYFNVNAFPTSVHTDVKSAESRFAIFHYQMKLLHTHLANDRARLKDCIAEPKMELESVLIRNSRDRYTAKLDGLETLACVHALFYLLKSFLDVYAQLLCHLVTPKQSITFKRKKIGKDSIAGGVFVDWLRNCAPSEFANANALADLIEKESAAWITKAVGHRDTLGHYSDIEDIHAQQVPLLHLKNAADPMYFTEDMAAPRMPDGQSVQEYMLYLGDKIREFVKKTLVLYPEINHKLLHYREFDLDEPLWPVASTGHNRGLLSRIWASLRSLIHGFWARLRGLVMSNNEPSD